MSQDHKNLLILQRLGNQSTQQKCGHTTKPSVPQRKEIHPIQDTETESKTLRPEMKRLSM